MTALYGLRRGATALPRLVQNKQSGGSGSTSLTLDDFPTHGNVLLAVTGRQTSSTNIATVTCTGVTFRRLASSTPYSNGEVEMFWGDIGPSASSKTVTATFSTGNWASLGVFEVTKAGMLGVITSTTKWSHNTIPFGGEAVSNGGKMMLFGFKNGGGGGAGCTVHKPWVHAGVSNSDFCSALLVPAITGGVFVPTGTAGPGSNMILGLS